MGAGIAGLLTARVLSEFYGSVTLVERDALPDHPEQRKGVPQGRHLHNFLSRGTQILGELLPGLLTELAAAGAVVDDGDDLSRTYVHAVGYELKPAGRLTDPGSLAAYQASRPFMEFHIRRRVAALDNVMIVDNHDVDAPMIADGTVTGARIINRDSGIATSLDAEIVIDATGRAARATHFLDRYGFGAVPEVRLPSVGGYSSQLMRIPPGRITERMAFVNRGSRSPGLLLVAYEHDTWMLAITCPDEYGTLATDFTELLEAAGQMLPDTIMAGLSDATPVGQTSISRSTAAAWRRFDRMRHLPEGLVVVGDALCNLNPLYGQGMTMAALQALALRDCLRAGHADLPRRFYRVAAEQIEPVWTANQANDRAAAPSATRTPRDRLSSWAQHAALKAATNDIVVAERLFRVRGMIDPPTRLQDPALLLRILLNNLRHPRPKPYVAVSQSSSPSSVNRADEQAIHTLIDRQVRGWDAGDPEAYASVFTLDADYVTFLGSRHKGREAIAMAYAPLFRTQGSSLRTQITRLRYLTSDVALVQARAAVTTQAHRWIRRADRINTSVAVRTEDGWLLASSQNTTRRLFSEKLLSGLDLRSAHR
ncbi:SgcJ/EcaC family oxidoreductase [Mycolicibacterium sp. CBMA 295]|uniref:SgcJ/EcaC family oxidoreductase n=1 Tax=Mycolicibacterium sp. CBMA 295 TaxID=2606605 RepID=UPI0012DFD826|nr:SgcJ/EcaC family oxidoreductase [Mycolicibacterium sp. CBMA 295]MUM28409.1 SgcJ/EcaC family oxidoreductase [Mycolicibacterium sp. CBMA 295]